MRNLDAGRVYKIEWVSSGGQLGNAVWIRHISDSQITVYAHLDSITVAMAAELNLDAALGTCGSTGNVHPPDVPHLHLGLKKIDLMQGLDQYVNLDPRSRYGCQ